MKTHIFGQVFVVNEIVFISEDFLELFNFYLILASISELLINFD